MRKIMFVFILFPATTKPLKTINEMTTTMAMEKIDAASLPQNIEAEQALLGALLSNNKAFEQVSTF